MQVFKAVQDDVRIVAVKLSHNDNDSGVASINAFWREIETIADLRDRNVGSVMQLVPQLHAVMLQGYAVHQSQ